MNDSSLNSTQIKPGRGGGFFRRYRFWLISFAGSVCALALVLAVAVVSLPTMLSMGLLHSTLQRIASQAIAGQISWDKLTIGWGQGQRMEGVKIAGADGKTILSVSSVNAPDVSLWSLLWGGRQLGAISLNVDQGDIIQQKNGLWNIAQAMETKPSDRPVKEPDPSGRHGQKPLDGWRATFAINIHNLRIAPADAQALTIQQFVLQGDASDPAQAVSFDFNTQVFKEDQLAGKAHGQVQLSKLFDTANQLDFGAAQVDAKVALEDLPGSLLATLIGQPAHLQEVVGEKVSASLVMEGPLLAPKGHLQLDSSQLQADIQLASTAEALTLAPGSKAQLAITPSGWQVLTAGRYGQLQRPVSLSMQFQTMRLPRQAAIFNWSKLQATAELKMTDMGLQGIVGVGQLDIKGTSVSLKIPQLDSQINLDFHTQTQVMNKAGQVGLQAKVLHLLNDQGQLNLTHLTANIQSQFTQIPLEVVDQLVGGSGKLVSLLGSTLQADIVLQVQPSQDGNDASGPFRVSLQTDRLKGLLAGSLGADGLRIDSDSFVALNVTDQSVQSLGLAKGTLLKPTALSLQINQALIPRSASGFLLDQAQLDAVLASGPVALSNIGSLEGLEINGLSAKLMTKALGDLVKIQLDAQAKTRSGTSAIKVDLDTTRVLASLLSGKTQTEPMKVAYDLTVDQLPLATVDHLAGLNHTLEQWLGSMLKVGMKGVAQSRSLTSVDSWLEQGELAFTAQSSQLLLNTQAKMKQGILKIDPASQIVFQIASDRLKAYKVVLKQPVRCTINLADVSLPIWPWDWQAIGLGKVAITTTPFVPSDQMVLAGFYSLSGLQGQVVAPKLSEQVQVMLQGQANQQASGDSPFEVQATIRRPWSAARSGRVQAKVSQVPVLLVDGITGQKGLLVDVLGKQIEILNLTADLAETTPGQTSLSFNVAAKSSHFQAPQVAGKWVLGQSVEITKAAPFTLTLTPEAYRSLMGKLKNTPVDGASATGQSTKTSAKAKKANPITQFFQMVLPDSKQAQDGQAAGVPAQDYDLAENARIELQIRKAMLDLQPTPQNPEATTSRPWFHFQRLAFDATAGISNLIYQQKNDKQDKVTVSKLEAQLTTGDSLAKSLQVKIAGQTRMTGSPEMALALQKMNQPVSQGQASVKAPGEEAGLIDSSVIFTNLAMLPEGGFDWYHTPSQWQVNIEKLPVLLIDQFLSQPGQTAGLLGRWVDLKVKGQFPGDLDIQMLSPQASLTGQLAITPQRVVHLRDDLKMKLAVTPDSVAVLGLLNPQLLAMESSSTPVALTVLQQNFALPIPEPGQALETSKIRSNLALDLGDVRLRKQGLVNDVFEVLAGLGGRFQSGRTIDVRFTPLKANIQNGQMVTNDMWLISDDLVMGTQAHIDISREPAFATVYVGLSGQTIMKLPGARQNLPADTVIDLKMAAPLSKLKLDKGALILKITPLLVMAYGGKEGGQVIEGVQKGLDLIDRLTRSKDQPSNDRVTWPNHPLPKPSGRVEATPSKATTKQEQERQEPSLMDLFKKKKKK